MSPAKCVSLCLCVGWGGRDDVGVGYVVGVVPLGAVGAVVRGEGLGAWTVWHAGGTPVRNEPVGWDGKDPDW